MTIVRSIFLYRKSPRRRTERRACQSSLLVFTPWEKALLLSNEYKISWRALLGERRNKKRIEWYSVSLFVCLSIQYWNKIHQRENRFVNYDWLNQGYFISIIFCAYSFFFLQSIWNVLLGVLQFLSWLRLLASYSSLGYTLWSVASTGDCIIGLILSRLIIFIVHFSFCVVSKLMMPRTKFAFSIFFYVLFRPWQFILKAKEREGCI